MNAKNEIRVHFIVSEIVVSVWMLWYPFQFIFVFFVWWLWCTFYSFLLEKLFEKEASTIYEKKFGFVLPGWIIDDSMR